MANVSVATASRALSNPDLVAESTRKAVREAAASCGYRINLIARSLRIQRTNTLLLLAPCVDNPFYPSLVRAIEEAVHEQGYSLIIGFTLKNPDSRRAYSDLISDGRVDGVILIDGGVGICELTGKRPEIPAVQVLDVTFAPSVPAIRVDDRLVAELAVRHLASLGHRRIAHISGAPSALPSLHREEGYRALMTELGLPVEEGYVQCGYYRRESAIEAMDRLLSLEQRPTAVFCTNDTMACGAMQLCLDRGMRIPNDISFVGAGNTYDGETMRPALTTVHVPRAEIGRLAAMKLMNLIRGQHHTQPDTVLPVELVVRGSTSSAASRIAVA
jgi:LacI family transcriptional regulator, repressor for deo operon, udp, cdd, tsx, nupC, and nupG